MSGLIKWIGRVLLWILVLPIGIWRTIRHGRRKDIEDAIRAAQKGAKR